MSQAVRRRTSPGSVHNSPVHRRSREATPASLCPFTYRWPKEEVIDVVEKAQFLELVRHSGWLLKQHGNGPHPSWSRRWVHIPLPAGYKLHRLSLLTPALPAVLFAGRPPVLY